MVHIEPVDPFFRPSRSVVVHGIRSFAVRKEPVDQSPEETLDSYRSVRSLCKGGLPAILVACERVPGIKVNPRCLFRTSLLLCA